MAHGESSFTYSIARSYPYPWFKWVVLFGGIVAFILFTAINLAAAGYELSVNYTPDWNQSVNHKIWIQRPPFSWIATTQTWCQSLDLPVNDEFYTDKLGLLYTITRIWQQSGNDSSTMHPLATLSYTNNPIENCTVTSIKIEFETSSRTAEQFSWKPWGVTATGLIRCLVNNGQIPTGARRGLGPTWFNLTTEYEFITSDGTEYSSPAVLNERDNPNAWWSRSLLSWYWLALVDNMFHEEGDSNTELMTKGSISIVPNSEPANVTSTDFFSDQNTYTFLLSSSNRTGSYIGPHSTPNDTNQPHTLSNLAALNVTPNIWSTLDSFARAFYSCILTDLGQNSTSQNILLNTEALQMYTRNFTNMTGHETDSLKGGPARSGYTGGDPLTVTPSFVYTSYLCQVPKLKSAGSLIVSVLVADLVFMEAAWKCLMIATTWIVTRRDPRANYAVGCLGCAEGHHGQAIGLRTLQKGADSGEVEDRGGDEGSSRVAWRLNGGPPLQEQMPSWSESDSGNGTTLDTNNKGGYRRLESERSS